MCLEPLVLMSILLKNVKNYPLFKTVLKQKTKSQSLISS
ncbi:unknown [Crocosphaera subtropica ATCC 51142]|uniref:Uncharacterized protein n=1 Tax=Crocosphaera subtropica (strain ATCC 51142 / BH68) TaxID=43989 RepID=B1WVR9_CROS5|nr:unknown [Crocosphaera subtropica ATCC 51142]